MKKIIKYIVGIIAIALIYLLISNFNLIMYKIAIYQQEIVEKISELIEKGNEKIIYTMLFFTFLYGIVHSFGPGHGKTLVLTYSVKEKLIAFSIFFNSLFTRFICLYTSEIYYKSFR